jgi:hypothetical protein
MARDKWQTEGEEKRKGEEKKSKAGRQASGRAKQERWAKRGLGLFVADGSFAHSASPIPSSLIANMASFSGKHGES